MDNLVEMRKFPLGVKILLTEVVKTTSCEVNCNLEPDEYTVSAGTKYERSTMCLVHFTRCNPELAHGGSILLQLLRCTSC